MQSVGKYIKAIHIRNASFFSRGHKGVFYVSTEHINIINSNKDDHKSSDWILLSVFLTYKIHYCISLKLFLQIS